MDQLSVVGWTLGCLDEVIGRVTKAGYKTEAFLTHRGMKPHLHDVDRMAHNTITRTEMRDIAADFDHDPS